MRCFRVLTFSCAARSVVLALHVARDGGLAVRIKQRAILPEHDVKELVHAFLPGRLQLPILPPERPDDRLHLIDRRADLLLRLRNLPPGWDEGAGAAGEYGRVRPEQGRPPL